MKSKIAVLIPCYNESKTIGKVVNDFKSVLPEADVYVYDNNSSDHTDEIAREAGAIVRYERRQGKGNVMRSMFRDIDADCYLMIDGDDQMPSDIAPEMCRMVIEDGVDMVIGNRLSTNYKEVNSRSFHNFGNVLVLKLVNKIFRAKIGDIMSGYRAMSRNFVKHFPVLSGGFEIETEMTIHALDKNFYIQEVPFVVRNRPEGSESSMNTYVDGAKVLLTIARLFRDYRPFLFFSIITLFLLLIAAVGFIPVMVDYVETGLVPRFPTLIVCGLLTLLAFMFFFCGITLEVLTKKHRQLFEILMNK
jgi:glycosyltransferase involved in cell wall biosynthesis